MFRKAWKYPGAAHDESYTIFQNCCLLHFSIGNLGFINFYTLSAATTPTQSKAFSTKVHASQNEQTMGEETMPNWKDNYNTPTFSASAASLL